MFVCFYLCLVTVFVIQISSIVDMCSFFKEQCLSMVLNVFELFEGMMLSDLIFKRGLLSGKKYSLFCNG